jgi:hypothetical protein
MSGVIIWQRVEAALVLVAGLILFWQADSGLPWWMAVLVFFAPDLSFAFYAAGNRIGAAGYNLVHVYGFGLALFVLGSVWSMPLLAGLGALWLAHSGFDRMLGYGLKTTEGFGYTHLGRIGRQGR